MTYSEDSFSQSDLSDFDEENNQYDADDDEYESDQADHNVRPRDFSILFVFLATLVALCIPLGQGMGESLRPLLSVFIYGLFEFSTRRSCDYQNVVTLFLSSAILYQCTPMIGLSLWTPVYTTVTFVVLRKLLSIVQTQS